MDLDSAHSLANDMVAIWQRQPSAVEIEMAYRLIERYPEIRQLTSALPMPDGVVDTTKYDHPLRDTAASAGMILIMEFDQYPYYSKKFKEWRDKIVAEARFKYTNEIAPTPGWTPVIGVKYQVRLGQGKYGIVAIPLSAKADELRNECEKIIREIPKQEIKDKIFDEDAGPVLDYIKANVQPSIHDVVLTKEEMRTEIEYEDDYTSHFVSSLAGRQAIPRIEQKKAEFAAAAAAIIDGPNWNPPKMRWHNWSRETWLYEVGMCLKIKD